ncbi:MAG: MC/SLC25 family protein [Simkaniaceae bacterium]|nr:MC/SLC25 family protein [Simkaniaceae bacterium]
MPVIVNQAHSVNSTENFLFTLSTSALGGFVGGFLCFPPEGLKKRLQAGGVDSSDFHIKNFPNGKVLRILHPLELFRGSVAFASAVMVASTTSMTFNALMKTHPSYDESSKIWGGASAILSGMLGAIVGSTPVENTILVQQVHKLGPSAAMQHMIKQSWTRPWVGVKELMFREAGFAGVMLFAGPETRRVVLDKTHSPSLAFAAEIIAGIGGSFLTHPADSIATYRQKLDGKLSLSDAIKTMYKEGGMRTFFKGAIFRSMLFTGCATIIPRASKIADEILR